MDFHKIDFELQKEGNQLRFISWVYGWYLMREADISFSHLKRRRQLKHMHQQESLSKVHAISLTFPNFGFDQSSFCPFCTETEVQYFQYLTEIILLTIIFIWSCSFSPTKLPASFRNRNRISLLYSLFKAQTFLCPSSGLLQSLWLFYHSRPNSARPNFIFWVFLASVRAVHRFLEIGSFK